MKFVDDIVEQFQDMSILKWIRLVVIVGGYILFRNIVEKELQKRKIKNQIKEDEKAKVEAREKELIEDPLAEVMTESINFGWGNRTRKRVEKQKDLFEKKAELLAQQQQYSHDESDADIEDLLVDD
ncbi:hypothetical protein TBLA_0D00300 [Henningerozyma blattae CBS 6284]|uniref:Processing of GAS1 and ALP protein 2 n=1 Tax=Henningerozyma blattae (strain ATCC 34711 / CBS 6284 / DSM 70876 / NBRC 10599 / NRRL Y-10934 / UCD 77-7) TaxID=1071380 RepID=I2H2D8_HENB6|nr:hypothetical protein TBLA_0D00300 [Tetrapisispora blattae CBS 6284]CCH60540.1 hypothetical protein TBLA_0D00300 [Tetrapisispora blattae CBS 6284]